METPQRSTLGRLLRGWRERKNWTLKEMSSRTSIPVSTLSKVERDRLTLTYDKLLQVSQGLQITLYLGERGNRNRGPAAHLLQGPVLALTPAPYQPTQSRTLWWF